MIDASKIENDLHKYGFTQHSIPLASPKIANEILQDTPIFEKMLQQYQARQWNRIPYLITAGISSLINDSLVKTAVDAALGTDNWVMWGPNIRRATPNDAHQWHTDLESDLWPTITMAVGLSGCSNKNGTWFLPGTHQDKKKPAMQQQVREFANGSFYLFNAHCHHRSDATVTKDRVVLFTHFQQADLPRVPLMLDHKHNKWSNKAAPYIAPPQVKNLCESVAGLPLRYRLHCAIQQCKGIFRGY